MGREREWGERSVGVVQEKREWGDRRVGERRESGSGARGERVWGKRELVERRVGQEEREWGERGSGVRVWERRFSTNEKPETERNPRDPQKKKYAKACSFK